MDGTVRVRSVAWLATAVLSTMVCTVIVTQAWSVGASPGDDDATYVPTAGCRVTDTRSTSTVGPRSAPLGADTTFTVTVHGDNGECGGALAIPIDAVGVALNVTVVNATAPSNIRVFPADLVGIPLLSNLNVTAGAPPTPNKVDVKLSPDGKIEVYNRNGSVDVVIDIVGYYTNSTLKELASSLGTASAQIAALEALDVGARLDSLEAARPFSVAARRDGIRSLTPTVTGFVSVEITAPVAGRVTVNSQAKVVTGVVDGNDVACIIVTSTDPISIFKPSTPDVQYFEGSSIINDGNLAGTRGFDIAADETLTFELKCAELAPGGLIESRALTAIFTPA